MTQIEFEKWMRELFYENTKSISKKKDEEGIRQMSLIDFNTVGSKLMNTAYNYGVASITGGIEEHE